jgi:hypothetical protein
LQGGDSSPPGDGGQNSESLREQVAALQLRKSIVGVEVETPRR